MSKHTPTPWDAAGCTLFETARECQPFQAIGSTYNRRNEAEDKANAAFIVRAVNAHEALVEALEAVGMFIEEGDTSINEIVAIQELINDVLAKARTTER